jgi:hypothetical protein
MSRIFTFVKYYLYLQQQGRVQQGKDNLKQKRGSQRYIGRGRDTKKHKKFWLGNV